MTSHGKFDNYNTLLGIPVVTSHYVEKGEVYLVNDNGNQRFVVHPDELILPSNTKLIKKCKQQLQTTAVSSINNQERKKSIDSILDTNRSVTPSE